MIRNTLCWVTASAAAVLSSCQSTDPEPPQRAMTQKVELKRFMGPWYVIAHIPTSIEKDAYNAVESYELAADGSISTTFTFNRGSFDGPRKIYHPRGFIYNHETNAEWRMQFIWPFKAAYLITSLDDDYQTAVIGVPNRSYVWIMARSKSISEASFARLKKHLAATGHDVSKLRRVPQR